MYTLRATDALSPALARTRLILFSPFRKGRTWKLAATAYLSTLATLFLPFPLLYLGFLPHIRHLGSTAVGFAATAILILTLLFLVVFHLCNRLRFAFFDIVLNHGEFVAPAWSKYGSPSLRWTAFKVVVGTILTAIVAVPTASYFTRITVLLSTIKPGQTLPPQFIAGLFAGYALFYLLFGLVFFASSILGDFIVPSLALENTSLLEAFRRLGQLIAQDPAEFFLYALLKFGLGVAGYIAVIVAFQIVFILTLLIAAIVLGIIGFLLHLAGIPTAVLIAVGAVIALAFYFFFLFYILFILLGTLLTFLESYAIYFLAGRYPLMGDLLDRSTLWPPLPGSFPPAEPSTRPSNPTRPPRPIDKP